MRMQAVDRQFVFVGATYPDWVGDRVKSVVKFLQMRFPGAEFMRTDLLHRASPKIEHQWKYFDADEPQGHLKLLESVLTDQKTMVFVNSVAKAKEVSSFLRSLASEDSPFIKTPEVVGALHKEIPPDERTQTIDAFRMGTKSILVSTDLASRGLDFGLIGHIVQAEFAPNVTQFLHRVGRTARASFLLSGPERYLATHIVCQQRSELADEIRRLSEADEGAAGLGAAFSRNRSFRRKLKKKAALAHDEQVRDVDNVDQTVASV